VLVAAAAFQQRTDPRMAALAELLAPRFEAFTYGGGVEGLEAVIARAGGSAGVFGMSSGGDLALEAARALPITRVAVYGVELSSLPVERLRSVRQPALVIDGENSGPEVRRASRVLWRVLPDVQRRTLEGQGSDCDPEALAPALEAFFAGSTVRGGVEA
jgi:hypothetical protein